VSTVLEEDEVEEDDTENDVSYGQQSQTSSANNSILSTPTRSNRQKVPLNQEQTVEVHDGCNYSENASTALSPPPSRVMSPISVSSPSLSAALDYGNHEPLSPVEWYCNQDEHDVIPNNELQARSPLHDYNDDYEPPPPPPLFAPSFFTTTTPWMCVFDLDAACGGGDSSNPILDTTEQHQDSSSVASPKSAPQQHEHWNDLLPTVMDFSQWFTNGNSYTGNATPDCRSIIHAQSPGSPTEFDQDESDHDENDHDDPKLLSPLMQLPLSPISVRQPLVAITTATTDGYPLISKQLFTNYATNCDIETIYYTPPPAQPQSMVCFYYYGYWYYYHNLCTFFVLVYRRALDEHYLSPMFFRSDKFRLAT
jgi:hypothetical protein